MCCDNSPTGSRSHCEGTPDYLARSMAHYERSERFFAEARKWYVKGNTTRAAWYTLDAKEERRLGSRDIRKAIETGEIEGVIPERGQRMGNFIGSETGSCFLPSYEACHSVTSLLKDTSRANADSRASI